MVTLIPHYFSKADKVVCVTKSIADYVHEISRGNCKTEVIGNGAEAPSSIYSEKKP